VAKKKPVTVMPSSLFGVAPANTAKPTNATVDLLAKLRKQNAASEQTIRSVGSTPPSKGSKPSFLEKVVGPLQVGSAAVNAAVHNITTDNPDLNILTEMGKAAKGERYITGSDLFGEWGWNPKTAGGKFAKGIVGFAWDIAADPLTYMTFGLNKASKFALIDDALRVAKEGMKVSDLASAGIKVAGKADDVVDVMKALTSAERTRLFKELGWRAAQKFGDRGGIKFFGKSLVPGKVISDATPDAAKGLISAAQRTKPAMAVGSAFDDFYRLRHARDPFQAAVLGDLFRTYTNVVNTGIHEGIEAGRALAKSLPKQTRNLVGFALDDAMPAASKARVTELADMLRGKSLDEIAEQGLTQFQDEIARLLDTAVDWDKFGAVLKALDPSLADDTIEQSITAMRKFSDDMRALKATESAAGVFSGDMGAAYFPRVRGDLTRAARKQLEAVGIDAARPALDDVGVPGASRAFGGGTFQHERSIGSLKEAVERGGVATYAPEVVAKRTAESARAVAAKQFKDEALRLFGDDAFVAKQIDALTRPLFDDKAASELVSMFNRLTSMWRRWATVMNPGFAPRNAISNYFLAYTKNMADPLAWEWAARLRAGALKPDDVVSGITRNGKAVTVREFLEAAREHGALRGGQMFEVAQDALERSLPARLGPVRALQSAGTAVNEFAEDWGRLAVFVQAWRKYKSPAIAGRMADAVLYNYDPKALTSVERGLRSVIPFMTWTRRNIPEMLSVLIHDPSKIGSMGKLQSNMAAVSPEVDEDVMPGYMRDMLPIPLPFTDKNGNPLMLNPNFGFQDLNRLDQPLRDTIASINPLFKVPLEIAFNKDVYFQRDLEAYKGQLKNAPGYLQALEGAVGGQEWWELLKSKLGAATVEGKLRVSPRFIKVIDGLPFLANLGKALETDSAQQPWRTISWLAGVKMMPYQQEKFTTDTEYQYRTDLRAAVRKLRDEGVLK